MRIAAILFGLLAPIMVNADTFEHPPQSATSETYRKAAELYADTCLRGDLAIYKMAEIFRSSGLNRQYSGRRTLLVDKDGLVSAGVTVTKRGFNKIEQCWVALSAGDANSFAKAIKSAAKDRAQLEIKLSPIAHDYARNKNIQIDEGLWVRDHRVALTISASDLPLPELDRMLGAEVSYGDRRQIVGGYLRASATIARWNPPN